MAWSIEFTKQADKDLAIMDPSQRQSISYKIDWLAENFNNLKQFPLHGNLSGFFKLRCGDWRIIYTLSYSTRIITIRYIDRRDRVYKK